MGIDTALAIDNLKDEFVCSICHDIVVYPVVISKCEHYFCGSCIRPWIQANATCPKDRDPTEEAGLSQPVRFYRNMLAEVRLRCQFSGCNTETTYEGFRRHEANCRKNPDAWMECALCHEKHTNSEEETHKQSCLPFLRDKIAKKELENSELKRKREVDKKKYDDLERMAKKPRNARYIFTWKAELPTPENHTVYKDIIDTCYTWSNHVGNLVHGTKEKKLWFQMDHGEMRLGLGLTKSINRRRICFQFKLKTGKMGNVKFNCSLTSDGKVLWQNERTEQLKVKRNTTDGWTGGHIHDDLPTDLDLPSSLVVVVEVIEWEPNTE